MTKQELSKQWREKNKEKIKAYQKEYRKQFSKYDKPSLNLKYKGVMKHHLKETFAGLSDKCLLGTKQSLVRRRRNGCRRVFLERGCDDSMGIEMLMFILNAEVKKRGFELNSRGTNINN